MTKKAFFFITAFLAISAFFIFSSPAFAQTSLFFASSTSPLVSQPKSVSLSNPANAWTFSENFNNLAIGDLNGQNGWQGLAGRMSVESGTAYEGGQAAVSNSNAYYWRGLGLGVVGDGNFYAAVRNSSGNQSAVGLVNAFGCNFGWTMFDTDGYLKRYINGANPTLETLGPYDFNTWYLLNIGFHTSDATYAVRYRTQSGNWSAWSSYQMYRPCYVPLPIGALQLWTTGSNDYFDFISPDETPPPVLTVSDLKQLKSDGTTEIPESATTTENTVIFQAKLNSTQNSLVKLQVELRRFTEPFNENDEGAMQYSGLVSSGSIATTSRANLSDGQYKWRARAVDNQGNKSEWQEFGTAGNVDFVVHVATHILVILTEPSDADIHFDASHGESYFKTTLIPNVENYWCEVSFGKWDPVAQNCNGGLKKFNFSFAGGGKIYKFSSTSGKDMLYYGQNFPTPQTITIGTDGNGKEIQVASAKDRSLEFAWDAINLADSDVDYNQYDTVLVIHPLNSEQSCLDFPPFSYPCPDALTTQALNVGYAAYAPVNSPNELAKNWVIVAEDDPVGSWAHEIGHTFGLCDLYKGGPACADIGSVGDWDLMGSGSKAGFPFGSRPTQLSSFSKIRLNWLNNNDIISYGTHQIESLETLKNGASVKRINLADGGYYLLEARTNDSQYSYWDNSLPGDNLVIYKISPSRTIVVDNQNFQVNLVNASSVSLITGWPLDDQANDFSIGITSWLKDSNGLAIETIVSHVNRQNRIIMTLHNELSILGRIWKYIAGAFQQSQVRFLSASTPGVYISHATDEINVACLSILRYKIKASCGFWGTPSVTWYLLEKIYGYLPICSILAVLSLLFLKFAINKILHKLKSKKVDHILLVLKGVIFGIIIAIFVAVLLSLVITPTMEANYLVDSARPIFKIQPPSIFSVFSVIILSLLFLRFLIRRITRKLKNKRIIYILALIARFILLVVSLLAIILISYLIAIPTSAQSPSSTDFIQGTSKTSQLTLSIIIQPYLDHYLYRIILIILLIGFAGYKFAKKRWLKIAFVILAGILILSSILLKQYLDSNVGFLQPKAVLANGGPHLSDGQTNISPDIDLHAITPDGKHTGMNYQTGQYENQIPGAISSGDLVYDDEWISVPEGTQVKYYVSSHNIQQFLQQNPGIAQQLPSTQDNYNLSAIYYDSQSQKYTSQPLQNQPIDPGQNVVYQTQGTTDIFISPGVVDNIPPTTTIQLSGIQGLNNWYISDVQVSLSAADNPGGVGVKQTLYSLDNGSSQVYASPIAITTEGTHTLQYYSVDFFGNQEVANTLTVKVDKTPPQLQLTANPNVLWPPNHKMVNVTIGGFASDSLSGLDSIYFKVVDEYGKVQPAIFKFGDIIQLEAWRNGDDLDGRHYTISATATDKAGNQSTISTTVICPHDQRKSMGTAEVARPSTFLAMLRQLISENWIVRALFGK